MLNPTLLTKDDEGRIVVYSLPDSGIELGRLIYKPDTAPYVFVVIFAGQRNFDDSRALGFRNYTPTKCQAENVTFAEEFFGIGSFEPFTTNRLLFNLLFQTLNAPNWDLAISSLESLLIQLRAQQNLAKTEG